MYRVMMIDDEVSARKLLQQSIDWDALSMELAGEAGSGIEAINIIDDVKPDIIFVDINMPFMNGIEFTKLATSRYPNLMIIILTAYDDFEYARQCIRLPVVDYMLKPIVRTDVTEVLTRVKNELDKMRPAAEPDNEISDSTIGQIRKYLRENYTNPEINLTYVAREFGFSACYLSRKFKQETGKTFVEYLMECRMEKALDLAKSNTKMFITAQEVGIPDPNYFGRVFKKYKGLSYSEYVNSARYRDNEGDLECSLYQHLTAQKGGKYGNMVL